MQAITEAVVAKGDIMEIFGAGDETLARWLGEGLPVRPDGRFVLQTVGRWLRRQHEVELQEKLFLQMICQRDLCRLLGVTRPTLLSWEKAGMPRRSDKSYCLHDVLTWLPKYYDRVYRRKWFRIGEKTRALLKDFTRKKP